jgi:transcription termination factor Rho
MDEVFSRSLKELEIVKLSLDRKIADKRIYPAMI